eukprot:scaffold5443_cov291-Pinguiococcus_pyrenoidosus.AAC.15
MDLTPCWVGFDFCSEVGPEPTLGTKLTCRKATFFHPSRSCSCRSASTKGMLSISPRVPPSSMIQTSGGSVSPSTGDIATCWMQRIISSVT